MAAGVGQQHVARVAGLSQSLVSRTERNLRANLTVEEAALLSAALGLRLHVRAYPEGSPVRDAAQLRLLERFRQRIGNGFRWRVEVPVGQPGDLRAWDARLDGLERVGVEAETRLHDVQATQRRVELKARDGSVACVILLVSATHHNRAVLREHAAALRTTFPLTSSEVLRSLERGEVPPANGIVML